MRRPRPAVGAQRPHGVGRSPAERQAEVRVDRLRRAHRVRHQVGVGHVKEPRRIVPGALGAEPLQPGRPQLQLVPPDHLAGERIRPARRRLRGQAADRRDRHVGGAVGLHDQRVRVDRQQRVEREQVAGVLQHPAAPGPQPDQLQVTPVPPVRPGPVLAAQPGGVGRQVSQALPGDRAHRLPEQLPALLHLVGGHVVHPHELGVLDVVPLAAGLDVLEDRVVRPGLPRRPGLRRLGQPQLQALVRRVRGEQPVQRGGAGPGQPDDEDRPLDADICVSGIVRPPGLAGQPGRQRAADQRSRHPDALGGQPGVPGIGLKQHGQAVAVVVLAEVRETGERGGRRVQFRRGADALVAAC